MKPVRTPGHPALYAKDYLKTALPALTAVQFTAGLAVPDQWTPHSKPHIGVFDDGGPTRWPVATRPVLRVTVWSVSETQSRDLAGLCMGVLLAHKIPGIAHVREPSSILAARDPKNDGLMASFTVRTTVRTLSV
ncbi:hypothetical protein [Rhodococcus tibetensis]|uniref:DUF3168 domain-containing protein n=1 Tax=Rhodococcus tibetensis TaxID=2965064 RepID=A0ABT1QCA4_9NOCA|nr:hypothetical protein [Rhodococcus sp. FXJ9.536]MCQ4119884.1 hypothetical protein [Rhodococcus sp. FXJ9.536]